MTETKTSSREEREDTRRKKNRGNSCNSWAVFRTSNLFSKIAIILSSICILLIIAVYLGVRGRIVLRSPDPTPFFEDSRGKYISEGWGIDLPKGYWKPEGEIPQRVKQCFLAIEDKRFYSHSGIDWHAVGRAIYNNITGGPRRGASTIAMQVARMQTPGKRTYWKKFCEIIIARLLINKYGHEAVFRHYITLAPQGNRIHGAAYAARRYFRKPLRDLGWAEAALLAAIPKAPGRMNLFTPRGFRDASRRAVVVLKLLFQQQKISLEEYRVSRRHLRRLAPPERETRPFHSYHAIMNMEETMRRAGVSAFHRPVRTTLDLELQNFLAFVSLDAMTRYRPLGAGNIAIIVVEIGEGGIGKIRGYLGSEYYYDDRNAGSIDYARTPRASGSTLKPFIYALGLAERRYTPSSILADLPLQIAHPSGQYLVSNYDTSFLGPLLYRKALANSRNTPAVQVIKGVGLEKAHEFFRLAGLERTDNNASYYGLGLAIGGLYITLEDLVRAYGILANDGREFTFQWFEQEDEKDRNRELPVQVLPEDAARQITLFLSDPLARAPSFNRMGVLEYPFPVAVKTGTSQGFRDAWAVAWSRRYIVGAWVGHPNNDRMKEINGAAAAQVVKQVMIYLHPDENRGVHEIPFPLPRGFQAVKICTLSGQLAGDFCSEILLEYFKTGTEPVSVCGVHRQYPVDRRTGLLATVHTHSPEIELKTFTVLPPEYSAWAVQQGYDKPPEEVPMEPFPPASLEIRNPVNRSRILMDRETPRRFQTLALRANVTPAVPRITWIVDGKEWESVTYPYVLRWPLEMGEHTFQARFPNANVQSDVVTISVSE